MFDFELEDIFDSNDISNIPDVKTAYQVLLEELDELTLFLRKAELMRHSELMRQAVAA